MQTRYRHLQSYERDQIELWLVNGKSCHQIARELKRSPSCISREVGRGFWPPFGRYTSSGGQDHYFAARVSAGRSRRKLPVDDLSSPLWQFCLRMLRCRLSPEQISGVLRHCSPLDPNVAGVAPYVCTQSIYQAISGLPHSPGLTLISQTRTD
jgi:IS30 family transposase